MEHSAFININLLNKEAKKELKAFYDYLLFKYNLKSNKNKNVKKNRFSRFTSDTIKVDHFHMPDREERNER